VADDLLEPKPPVGVTRGLIRQRDKAHVGTIWLNRDMDYEFENPATGQRHTSPIPQDIGGDLLQPCAAVGQRRRAVGRRVWGWRLRPLYDNGSPCQVVNRGPDHGSVASDGVVAVAMVTSAGHLKT